MAVGQSAPKGEAAFHGEYREIFPPSRLVFTEIFEVFPTACPCYESPQVREMVFKSGMVKGATISYDRLEDLVAELQRSGR